MMDLLRLWWNGPAMPTLHAISCEEMVFRCSKCHLLIEGTRNFAMHENLGNNLLDSTKRKEQNGGVR